MTAANSAQIELKDLLKTYNDIDDNIAESIAAKHEFQTIAEGDKAGMNNLFIWQRLIYRYLSGKTPYDSMAFLWDVGSGKTVMARELIKAAIRFRMDAKNKDAPKIIRKPIIIVRKAIEQSWADELVKDPFFSTDKINADDFGRVEDRRTAITNVLKHFVTIKKQDKFAIELAGGKKRKTPAQTKQSKQSKQGKTKKTYDYSEPMTTDEIRAKYPTDLIIFDEAHTAREDIDHVAGDYDEDGYLKSISGNRRSKMKNTYKELTRFMQISSGVKIIMTATPMADKINELPSVLNLILPPENNIKLHDFKRAYQDGTDALLAYLEPILRGRISYVAESIDNEIPFRPQGKTFVSEFEDGSKRESTIQVYEVPLQKEQWEIYQKTLQREESPSNDGDDKTKKRGQQGQNFKVRSRQALQFVYFRPNSRVGSKKRASKSDTFSTVKEDADAVGIKFTVEGVGFDYIPSPKGGSGIPIKDGFVLSNPIPRTKANEGEARRPHSITTFKFRYEQDFEKMFMPIIPDLGILGLEDKPEGLQMGDKLPRSRLEVIRRMSAKAAAVIEIVHLDNTFQDRGEYEVTYYYNVWLRDGGGILVGMAFEFVGYERFTVNGGASQDRARFAYMTGPPASTGPTNSTIKDIVNHPNNKFGTKIALIIASDVAAVGISFLNVRKFIHAGPTFQLIKQARGRTRRANSHKEFERQDQKFVKTYLLAAVGPDGEQTIDHDIWWKVQEKEKPIDDVMTVLQRISVDCIFNSKMDEKKHYCVGEGGKKLEVPVDTDYTTYHLHWAQEEFDVIEQKIRSFFLLNPVLTFGEIIAALGHSHKTTTVVWVLTRMLSRREVIDDRFGFSRILYEHNGTYYLSEVQAPDRLAARNVEVLTIKAPINPAAAYDTFVKEKVESEMNERDYDAFVEQWQMATSNMQLVELERALIGEISNEEVRRFVLTALAPTWFVTDSIIFHNFEEYRQKGVTTKFKNNANKQNASAVIRVYVIGKSDKFRNAEAIESTQLNKMFNKRWEKEEKAIIARASAELDTDVRWIIIKNVSSDSDYRLKVIPKNQRKTLAGKVDGRGPSGRVIWGIPRYVMLPAFYDMKLDDDTESIPALVTSSATKKEYIEKLNAIMPPAKSGDKVLVDKTWDYDKLNFFWHWLVGEKRSVSEAAIAKMIIDEVEKRGWVQLK